MALNFNVQDAMAKVAKEKTKVSLYNDWDTKGFCMADRKNQSYCPTWLFYRFALFNT